LDALAAGGVIFAQARSAATWTRPGTIAMLAGTRSGALGLSATEILPNAKDVRRFYAGRPPLLPLVLRPYGVITRAVVNNFYMFGYGAAGVDMGFEGLVDHRHGTLDTQRITTDTIAWLRENRDRRFALFVNYNSPHRPYVPPPSDLRAVPRSGDAPKDPSVRDYLGEIHKDDAAIGTLLNELDSLGLAQDTLVIATADHGEPLSSDHDGVPVDLWRGQAPAGRFHHMLTAWDETLRVPLIFRYPRKLPRGVVSQAPAQTLDILPTVLDLAGLGVPGRVQGRSLLSAAQGKPVARPLVMEARGARVILDGHWRLIVRDPGAQRVRTHGGVKSVQHELYDLETDPGERVDVSAEHADVVSRLQQELEALSKPAAPSSALAAAQGARPMVRLRFSGAGGAHRVSGRIRAQSAAAQPKLDVLAVQMPQSVVHATAQGVEIDFATSPQKTVGLDLDMEPATADLVWQFFLDGKPWPAERIYAGSFGLRALALEDGLRDEGGRLLAAAEIPPIIDPKSDLGLFITRDSVSHELELDQAAATEETMQLMQAWGYAKQDSDSDRPAH
jgi:arylsulfatase A-like enzyme